jgi:hypothetical protein
MGNFQVLEWDKYDRRLSDRFYHIKCFKSILLSMVPAA